MLLREALRAIREHDRFCLTTHERPDGDAVGSLAAVRSLSRATSVSRSYAAPSSVRWRSGSSR